MKVLFSVPTGYHLRELVLPLHRHLESDTAIDSIVIVTPAASVADKIFHGFSSRFLFVENPATLNEHKELFSKLQPDIVVTNTVGHDELDYPILKAANDCGITTFTFIASWDNVWKVERLKAAGKPIFIADHIVVWNTMMKEHLLRVIPSLSQEAISVIGAPRLDYFWHTEKIPSKEELYSYLEFRDTSKPLLHIATTELYPLDYVLEHIVKAQKDSTLPSTHLYASVHPGGDMKKHERLRELGATVRYSFGRSENPPHPAFAYIPTEKDIYMLVSLFKHASALVNHSSSTALESIIAGVPVINVTYGKRLDWWKWYRSMVYRDFKQHYQDLLADNATYVTKNPRELIHNLKEALSNPSAKQSARMTTLTRMITTTDGTASAKVLTKIKESIKNT